MRSMRWFAVPQAARRPFLSKSHRFDPAQSDHLESNRRLRYIEPASVVERMGIAPGVRLLDLGAGTGFFASPISTRAGEVVCLDISEKMLSIISERARSKGAENMTFVKGDIVSLPFSDGSIDHALAAFVYHEVADRPRLVSEVSRVLKPSGRFTVIDFRKRISFEGPPIWVKKSAKDVVRATSPWFVEKSRFESKVYYQFEFSKKT